MIPLDITLNIDNTPWQECDGIAELAAISRIGLLPNGTASGQPVVMIKMEMPDGSIAVGQTTWKLFRGAARALSAAAESMMIGVEDA